MADPFKDWISPFTGTSLYSQGGGVSVAEKPKKKGNYYDDLHEQIQQILTSGRLKASDIERQENERYGRSNEILAKGRASLDKPWLTDQDIARQFSGASDVAARTYSSGLHDVRAELGATGVGPNSGYAQARASRYARDRARSLTDATRSLYEKRVDMDVNQTMSQWAADQVQAAGISRDPSMIGMDWLGVEGNLALGEGGIHAEMDAAKNTAKANKQAGEMGLLGSVISGVAGIFA